jgi:hypothetical protein
VEVELGLGRNGPIGYPGRIPLCALSKRLQLRRRGQTRLCGRGGGSNGSDSAFRIYCMEKGVPVGIGLIVPG